MLTEQNYYIRQVVKNSPLIDLEKENFCILRILLIEKLYKCGKYLAAFYTFLMSNLCAFV